MKIRLQCEKCQKVYAIDSDLIKPEGIKVRCNNCKNIFILYPPKEKTNFLSELRKSETDNNSIGRDKDAKSTTFHSNNFDKVTGEAFDKLLADAELSVRALNVIKNNVENFQNLLDLDWKTVFHFKNCGRKTAREIINFIDGLRPPAEKHGTEGNHTKNSTGSIDFESLNDITGEQFKKFIQFADLSVRGSNVILSNVSNLKELLNLELNTIIGFKNCGRKTAEEINGFICMLHKKFEPEKRIDNLENFSTAEEKILKTLSEKPTEDALKLLPLFSNRQMDFIPISDFHKNYKVRLQLSNVLFSKKSQKLIEFMKIETLGELILTPGHAYLAQKGYGRKSLREIRTMAKNLVLDPLKLIDLTAINKDSYESMVESYVASCIKSKRNAGVLCKRFLPVSDRLITLEEIGVEYDITRERVRQIVLKGVKELKVPINRFKLKWFWSEVEAAIRNRGGMADTIELADIIQAQFGWETPPAAKSLEQFLELVPRLEFEKYDEYCIVLSKSECRICEKIRSFFNSIFDECRDPVETAALDKMLVEFCGNYCETEDKLESFSRAFLMDLVRNSGDLCVINAGMIYPKATWDIKHGNNLGDVAYHILQSRGNPLHFSDIAEKVRQISERYKDVSDRYVHSALIKNKDIVLAGRGAYALADWDLKDYLPVHRKIEDLMSRNGLPMSSKEVISALSPEYSETQITISLNGDKMFEKLGFDYFDIIHRWKSVTLEDLIRKLDEPVLSFASFLVSRNNSSYKPVLSLVFLKNIDELGQALIEIVEEKFYEFYRNRQLRGMIVESNKFSASKLMSLSKSDFKKKVLKRPFEVFRKSGYFHFENRFITIERQKIDFDEIIKNKKILECIMIKSVDEYFDTLDSENDSNTEEDIHGNEFPPKKFDYGNSASDRPNPISIKKMKKMKIRI